MYLKALVNVRAAISAATAEHVSVSFVLQHSLRNSARVLFVHATPGVSRKQLLGPPCVNRKTCDEQLALLTYERLVAPFTPALLNYTLATIMYQPGGEDFGVPADERLNETHGALEVICSNLGLPKREFNSTEHALENRKLKGWGFAKLVIIDERAEKGNYGNKLFLAPNVNDLSHIMHFLLPFNDTIMLPKDGWSALTSFFINGGRNMSEWMRDGLQPTRHRWTHGRRSSSGSAQHLALSPLSLSCLQRMSTSVTAARSTVAG